MGKSSSQANTTTTTSYTTYQSTNLGLSGSQVQGLLNTFSSFALAEQAAAQMSTPGNTPQDANPANDLVHQHEETILLIGGLFLGILFIWRMR